MTALVTTHANDGIARLTERYRKPLISALLGSWLSEVQALENASYDLLIKRSPATAEGATLDLLGKVVGQQRQGRTDEQYRLWIAARVLVNRSSGLLRQVLAIAAKLCNGQPLELREYPRASFMLYCHGPIVGADGVEIAKLLKIAKAAGVSMQFVWFDVTTAFRFSRTGAAALNSAHGLSAGRFAAVSDGRDMAFLPPGPEVEEVGFAGALLVGVI